MRKETILAEIFKGKAVAILRIKEADKLRKIIEAIYEGGISMSKLL